MALLFTHLILEKEACGSLDYWVIRAKLVFNFPVILQRGVEPVGKSS